MRLPLLFTAGVAYRLTCRIKADRPAEVALVLQGSFDGKPLKQEKTVQPGASWADVALDIALPMAFRSDLSFSVKLPENVRVLVEDVHFVPMRKEWSQDTRMPGGK